MYKDEDFSFPFNISYSTYTISILFCLSISHEHNNSSNRWRTTTTKMQTNDWRIKFKRKLRIDINQYRNQCTITDLILSKRKKKCCKFDEWKREYAAHKEGWMKKKTFRFSFTLLYRDVHTQKHDTLVISFNNWNVLSITLKNYIWNVVA